MHFLGARQCRLVYWLSQEEYLETEKWQCVSSSMQYLREKFIYINIYIYIARYHGRSEVAKPQGGHNTNQLHSRKFPQALMRS